MEALKRFDIAEHRGVAMVVVEGEFLPPDPAVVVIPLLPDYPAVNRLNPHIAHGDQQLVLATRLIAAVRRASLRRVGSAATQSEDIVRAIDVLMGGF
jgi:toxin CcdB